MSTWLPKLQAGLNLVQAFKHLPTLWRNPPQALKEIHASYGDIVRLSFGPWARIYVLSHPDYIKHVLVDNYRNYHRVTLRNLYRLGFGNGLITSQGELWKRQRRLIQPHFNHESVVTLIPLMIDAIQEKLAQWQRVSTPDAVRDIESDMLDITRTAIMDTLFGVVNNGRDVEAVRQAFLETSKPWLFTGWLPKSQSRLLRRYQKLEAWIWELIHERKRTRQNATDLLSLLMKTRDKRTGAGMSDQQLHNEVITLMYAGYETTAQTLTWTWYLLSQHPEVEHKLHAELADVLGGRTPTLHHLSQLRYTSMIIDEALRLYPPVWAVGWRTIEADQIGSYQIQPQSIVVSSQYVMHRHPDFWEDPEAFNPQRFAPHSADIRPDFVYFPFGEGPRQCIGHHLATIEMQLILAILAQHYRLRLVPGHPVEFDATVTLRPRYGMLMTLEEKNANY